MATSLIEFGLRFAARDFAAQAECQQGVGRAGVTRLFVKRDVFGGFRVGLFALWLFALRDGHKIVPVFDAQDVAGMTGAQEKQARKEATRIREEINQFVAGKMIVPAARFGEFK